MQAHNTTWTPYTNASCTQHNARTFRSHTASVTRMQHIDIPGQGESGGTPRSDTAPTALRAALRAVGDTTALHISLTPPRFNISVASLVGLNSSSQRKPHLKSYKFAVPPRMLMYSSGLDVPDAVPTSSSASASIIAARSRRMSSSRQQGRFETN